MRSRIKQKWLTARVAAAVGVAATLGAGLASTSVCLARGSRAPHNKHLKKEHHVEPIKSHGVPSPINPLQPGVNKGKILDQQVFHIPVGDPIRNQIEKLIFDVQGSQSATVDGSKLRTMHLQVRTAEQKALLMALELFMRANRVKAASGPILDALKARGEGSEMDQFNDALHRYEKGAEVIKSAQELLDYARQQYGKQIDEARSSSSEWVNPYVKAKPRIDIARAVDMVQSAIDQVGTDLASLQAKWNRTGSLVSGYIGAH